MNKIQQLLADSVFAALHEPIRASAAHTIARAVAIQQIPAPTFEERRRAAFVMQAFQSIGLERIDSDAMDNVYGLLPGTRASGDGVLVAAHTDTVFDRATPLDVKRDENRICAPGIGDNSLGVATLLTLAELFREHRPAADIWFVANSREEGMGDLGGIKAAYRRLKQDIRQAVVIEGMALGRIYHAGIAVRRLKIACEGPGGHSWLHFGRPSAIHGLMRLGAAITLLAPPEHPRTTFNIGVIDGGRSVNSIAPTASMLLDLRSEDRDTLAAFEQSVLNLLQDHQHSDLVFRVEVVGDRPAGAIPRTHALVQLARHALEAIGLSPIYERGSTDANALLAAGLPTVTVGVTQGSNAHRTDECIEIAPVGDGLWQLFLLISAAASAPHE